MARGRGGRGVPAAGRCGGGVAPFRRGRASRTWRLPTRRCLRREVRAYLRCGVLRHGFVRVRCDACGEEALVGFSCEGRGYCPSCNGKKATLAGLHLVRDVLPWAPYRQWTLSLPFRLRWLCLKQPRVLDVVLRALLARVAATQRRVARRLGVPGRLHAGAVSFTQYFGSTLQLTPHLHVLCPDGLFTEADDGAVRFVALPPPTPADVARIAVSLARRVEKALDKAGLLDVEVPPDDDAEVLRARALQQSLPFVEATALAAVQPRRHHRRVAVADGFSLYADTFVHEADRQGLERLCRYGARGPLAEERLSRADDGRSVYRLRRPSPSGATALVLTAPELVRRLASLLPPPPSPRRRDVSGRRGEGAAGVGPPPAARPAAHRASTAPAVPRRLTRLLVTRGLSRTGARGGVCPRARSPPGRGGVHSRLSPSATLPAAEDAGLNTLSFEHPVVRCSLFVVTGEGALINSAEMTATLRVCLISVVALVSGCAAVQRNAEPDGFQRSLAELRAKHHPQTNPLIGAVPYDYGLMVDGDGRRTLEATGVPAPDKDAIDQRKLLGFVYGTHEEFCFVLFEKLEWNDYGNLRREEEPEFIAARRKRIESGEFYLEAFDSLVDVPTRPVLPTSGASRLTVRDARMGTDAHHFQLRFYDGSGGMATQAMSSSDKEMMYDLCGPAPAVTPATRYFTVSHKYKEATLNEVYTHLLYVFARQDTGDPSLDLRGNDGSSPPSARPAATPVEPEPGAKTGKSTPTTMAGKPRSSSMMSVEHSLITKGTGFTLRFNKPMKAQPGEKFWVTIVFATAGDKEYTSYKYLEPDATSIDLAAPAVPGEYEVRLHGNYPTKTYNLIDRLKFKSTQGDPSAEPELEDAATVAPLPEDKGATSKMMSVAKARLDAKARFTLRFPKALKAKKNEKFWIAISSPSTADADYLTYEYIEVAGAKSIELSAPDAAGEYELRLHGNYPTKKVNVVDRLKITVK
ncbi:MAG: transposase [Myxococcota bacterium]